MKNPEMFSQGQENLNDFLKNRSEIKRNEEESKIEIDSLDGDLPEDVIEAILNQKGDYLALARMTGSDKVLEEIAGHFGDDSIEAQDFKISQKNFFTDFVNYLRAERKTEEFYLDSVRISQKSEELEREGKSSFSLREKAREFLSSLNETEDILERFAIKNPEVFIARNLKQERDYKSQLESGDGSKGRIVETPYVKKQLAQVESAIMEGAPIFIHGHLGSGKTEMALRAAYKYINKNKTPEEIDQNIENAYQDWLKGHPDATEKEKDEIKDEIIKESMSAVVISGSAETNISDFTGHRTLNLRDFDTEAKKIALEQANKELKKWIDKNPEASQEEKNLQQEGLLKVYLEKNGGTFSDFYIGPIYRAMREGRPIIIDEVDAIPHDSLIFLNHIMTREVGDVLPVQGDSGERVTVAKGFSVILTGNFPKMSGVDIYVGRKDLDAAFLSRLRKLEHDYLPQSSNIDSEKTVEDLSDEELQGGELFHVLVSKLIDRKGNLQIPEDEIDKVWKLSCFARKVQDVFSQKHSKILDKSGNIKDETELREKLHKEVLSMRQILNIMSEWTKTTAIRGKNDGAMQYQLDYYVMEYFIKTTPEDETKWELYKLARDEFGLFQEKDWPDTLSSLAQTACAGILPKFDIKTPKIKSGKMKILNPIEMTKICFGKGPERDESEYDISNFEEEMGGVDIESEIEKEKQFDESTKKFDRLKRMQDGEEVSIHHIESFSLSEQLERFSAFYDSHNIETPEDFQEQVTEIWNKNTEKIKEAIEKEGFDEILFIPEYNTEDVNNKTTAEYAETYEGTPISEITDTRSGIRIVLTHKAENLNTPELFATKNKSIYELCNATTNSEKADIDQLIQNKLSLPIEGLTLGEYLIADRIHFKETGQHLDSDTWTWLPASYSRSRVALSHWHPSDSQVYVYANDSGYRDSSLGVRSSRVFN